MINSPSILPSPLPPPVFLYHLQINDSSYLPTYHQTVINTNTNHRVRGKGSPEVWEDAGGYYFIW